MFTVKVDGCGRDFDKNACGDILSVAEGYTFKDAAAEGC